MWWPIPAAITAAVLGFLLWGTHATIRNPDPQGYGGALAFGLWLAGAVGIAAAWGLYALLRWLL